MVKDLLYSRRNLPILLDPLVISIVQDIFKELSKNSGCIVPLQTRLVPTLVSILQSPVDKVPMGLQAVSFESFFRRIFLF